MESFALKLLLTPVVIAAATLVGRRFGPAAAGWLVGFPLTSGPVVFFLALDHGSAFGADAATGALAGAPAQAVFCVLYQRAAARRAWPLPLAAGSLGFAAVAGGFSALPLSAAAPVPLVPLLAGAFAVLAAALVVMPDASRRQPAVATLPSRWDVPARMVVATGLVLLLTGVAPQLGARLSGLLATYPLYAAVLAVFAHRLQGPGAAAGVLRGLLVGLFAFSGFCFTVAVLIEHTGIGPAFAVAAAVVLVLQAGALRYVSRAGPVPGRG